MNRPIFDPGELQPRFRIPNRAPRLFELVPFQEIFRRVEEELNTTELPANVERNPSQHAREIMYRIYFFGIIPFPIINFPIVWSRFRQRSLSQWLGEVAVFISHKIIRLGRLLWYAIIMIWWLEDVCKFISIFGSMATYSPAFFEDIATYLVRNWPSVIDRKAALYKEWGDEPPIIEINSVLQLIMDNALSHVHASCTTNQSDIAVCVLDKNLLIFRFSDVLVRIWPNFDTLPSVFLTTITIGIYICYGIVAQFVGANVLIFFCVHSVYRWFPTVKFMSTLVKLMWNHSAVLIW